MLEMRELTPGDVVAVPGPTGKYYLGVFITANRFGHAFGFFRGAWPPECPVKGERLEPCRRPIYTGLRAVYDETWRVVGNRPELLKYFDNDPEIYHAKRYHLHNSSIGEFGAAERASTNELRQLGADEAAAVGLLDESYDAALLETEVSGKLAKWCSEPM